MTRKRLSIHCIETIPHACGVERISQDLSSSTGIDATFFLSDLDGNARIDGAAVEFFGPNATWIMSICGRVKQGFTVAGRVNEPGWMVTCSLAASPADQRYMVPSDSFLTTASPTAYTTAANASREVKAGRILTDCRC